MGRGLNINSYAARGTEKVGQHVSMSVQCFHGIKAIDVTNVFYVVYYYYFYKNAFLTFLIF